MIQAEVLRRTLRIIYNHSAGTAFTMEINGIQYIITAKHLFESNNYPSFAQIEVLEQKKYVTYNVDIRYHEKSYIDIAVMRVNPYKVLTPIYNNKFSLNDVILGQDVYFLGFPFEYDSMLEDMPGDCHPIPFVKKACLSSIVFSIGLLLLDGNNNPGFSGGPVCFKSPENNTFKIAGVISGYRYNKTSVFDNTDKETGMYVKENTGIVNAYDIKYALEIAQNWK